MSQYKISKSRLAEIIKEEYAALNEECDSTEAVTRMIHEGNFNGAIEAIEAMKDTSTSTEADTQKHSASTIRDMIRQELENL
jgi:hypothetical protein